MSAVVAVVVVLIVVVVGGVRMCVCARMCFYKCVCVCTSVCVRMCFYECACVSFFFVLTQEWYRFWFKLKSGIVFLVSNQDWYRFGGF